MVRWYTKARTPVCFNTHGELSTCVKVLFRFRRWQNIPYPLVKFALEIKLRLRHLIYDVNVQQIRHLFKTFRNSFMAPANYCEIPLPLDVAKNRFVSWCTNACFDYMDFSVRRGCHTIPTVFCKSHSVGSIIRGYPAKRALPAMLTHGR